MTIASFLRRPASLLASTLLLFASPGHAALIQVTMTGLTDNTFVGAGDPCGTGLSGGNACNNKALVITVQVDTGAAPADQDGTAGHGFYQVVSPPAFLGASATIGGLPFALPGVVTSSFGQSVEMFDNIDSGLGFMVDRAQFGVSGTSDTESFSVSPNVLMTSGAFSGDTLDLLAGIVGSPLAFAGQLSLSNGAFNFSNATGQVQGQYRLSQVAFSVVPAPPSLWLLGTAVAGLLGRRIRRVP
ncbi:MAG: hypothetical protein OEW88_12630 [Gammaproteobacteria bacterium]|nr:hypothetical protein [Gammaproteobacteria bacterium]